MIFKKRLLKVGCTTLLVLLFVAYFTFSTFFFSPFEGRWPHDVAGLIPRQVDFYAAKAGLEDTFDGFPRLAVMNQIERTDAWSAYEDSPEFAELKADWDFDAKLAEIEQSLAQLPLGLEPQDIFGGRDLALAGRFQPGGFAKADWAVYGRVNWAGKLAVALLAHPSWINLDAQGFSVEARGGHYVLSGAELEHPLFITRIRDVVVVSTAEQLVTEARTLANASGEASLFLSAPYHDYIQRASREAGERELELMVNVRKMLESIGQEGPWPDPQSQRFATAFLGHLIQAPACKNLNGVVGFNEGVSIEISGEISSEKTTGVQARIYREAGFDKELIRARIAKLAPPDTMLFVYVHGPVADILREALASAEPALRENLEEAFRSTGRYSSIDELIDQLGSALHNRLALVVRENDYPTIKAIDQDTQQPMTPDHDGSPVFAFTLVTWTRGATGEETLESIRDTIGWNGEKFGLQGGIPGKPGYYQFEWRNLKTREFWSPFVPGTGIISTLNTDEHCMITNHPDMYQSIYDTYNGELRSLADVPQFQALLDRSLDSGNLLVWFNPRAGRKTFEKQAERAARSEALSGIDWSAQRSARARELMPRLFPGKRREDLTPDEDNELENNIDILLDGEQELIISQRLPTLRAEKHREVTYLQSISSLMWILKLDPKSFKTTLRMVTPLEE
jgi:hypothetical protein